MKIRLELNPKFEKKKVEQQKFFFEILLKFAEKIIKISEFCLGI